MYERLKKSIRCLHVVFLNFPVTAPPHIKTWSFTESAVFTNLPTFVAYAFSQAAHGSSLRGLKIVADDDTCAA